MFAKKSDTRDDLGDPDSASMIISGGDATVSKLLRIKLRDAQAHAAQVVLVRHLVRHARYLCVCVRVCVCVC